MEEKHMYEVQFTTGLKLNVSLNHFDLKKLIHNYKVRGYRRIAE